MDILTKIITYITSFIIALSPTTKYVEGVVGQPRSFLPHQTVTQDDKTVSSLIYRGMFKYDIYGTLIPDLAENWTVSDEGMVYTIKLKDNQYWTDGTKITSDDILYTSFKVSFLSDVATDKVDELTVRYVLPNKFSPFLSLLTVGIMKNGSEENYNHLRPVTNGMYRILEIKKNGPVISEIVLLSSNSKQNIQKIVFKYYSNESEVVTAAKLGEIDAFIGTENYQLSNFEAHNFPLQGVYYALFFNLRNEKLQDVGLRKSLRKALDLENISADIGIPVEGVISKSLFTDDSINFNEYDELYFSDIAIDDLEITIPDLPNHREVAKRVKDVWEGKFKINVEIKRIDPNKINENVLKTRNFEILLYGQEVGRDPDRYVYWHSTQKDHPSLNLSGFEHVRADRALEEGRNEIDDEARVVHYHEFQEVVHDQVPAVFLYHPYVKYYVSRYIEGMGQKYTFTRADRFLDISNWKILKTN